MLYIHISLDYYNNIVTVYTIGGKEIFKRKQKMKRNTKKNKLVLSIIILLLLISLLIIQSGASFTAKDDELFIQEPYGPDDSKADCRASSTKYPHVVYEDFWDVTEPIGTVRWWGQSGTYSGMWNSCGPEGMTFRIVFYEDDNGVPGDMVSEYTDLTPSITPTGIIYEYEGYEGIFEMNYFEVQLLPFCDLSKGWISIISTGSDHGCAFLWANSPDGNKNSFQTRGGLVQLNDDFAFSLTEQLPNADLYCDDTLTWNDVQTGELVHGSISIRNNGEEDSLLDWEIISNPVWGENWSLHQKKDLISLHLMEK